MNYEGSGWKGFKKPYTPFTPKVHKKYAFDSEKAVRSDKALHEHFKLDGTFTGSPIPTFREDFQKKAKPPAKHDLTASLAQGKLVVKEVTKDVADTEPED